VVHHARMTSRVLVIDDHAAFRQGARRLLEQGPFQVVAEAADGETGIRAFQAHRPDIVLLDIVLPDIDGFEVATRLLDDPAAPAIVLVSTRDEADYGNRVQRSGACGFIQKSRLSAAAVEALVG
jgi:DNA-binding NarL/FixJ family response regulator